MTCGGYRGDFFSFQEQAGVCGTQVPVVGAARQPSPALPWLPDLRLHFEFAFLTGLGRCGGLYSAFCSAAASCTGELRYQLSQVSVLFSVEERDSGPFSVS